MADRAITDWAGSADSADYDDPGASLEQSGYAALQKLPHEEFNYLMRQMSIRAPAYTSLSEAYESVPDGTTVMVDEYDPSVAPLTAKWTHSVTSTGGATPQGLATDGDFVYWADQTNNAVYCVDRETGSLLHTLTITGPLRLCADGEYVFIALADHTVRCYVKPTRDGGWSSQVWTSADLADSITCVYSNGRHVFVTTVDTNDANTAFRLDRSAGTTDWASTVHTAVLSAVVATANRVFVGGEADTGVTVRELDYAAGTFVTNTGGSPSGQVLDLALVSVPSTQTGGSSDPARIGLIAAGVNDTTSDVAAYELLGLGIGSTVWTGSFFATGQVNGICWDGRRLFAAGSRIGSATLREIDPLQGNQLHEYDHGASHVGRDVVTDGFGVFTAVNDVTDSKVLRHHILVKPDWAKKLTGDEPHRFPWHIGIVKGGIEADYAEE